jgi:FtsP/CotA-like multicopper oxidase with cupredoxin domain
MDSLTRRRFLSLAGGGSSLAAFAFAQETGATVESAADITLRISEITLELAPRHSVKAVGYNGQAPGPLLRAPEGKPLIVDVFNETRDSKLVHWHGFHIPPEVDGSHEEGTPHVPGRGHRRYVFTPAPAGTRWYHTHTGAGHDLQKGTYTGQFGMFIVEPHSDPGRYDREVPLVLHEWDPFWEETGPRDVGFKLFSVNGKMLGAGEPVRVRDGQRVLLRFVTPALPRASPGAPGHQFFVQRSMHTVPAPRSVPVLELGPGERIDAVVEMGYPGIWVLGSADETRRAAGMGIVVEYADAVGPPRWAPAPTTTWDYTAFGEQRPPVQPDARVPLVFKETTGHRWTINGKSFPKTDPILVQANRRYRWIFDNQSADPHPVHLHRHTFELIRVAGKPTSGVMKDVVMVPAWKEVEVDVTADHPGPTLFHCHQQFHMDFGFGDDALPERIAGTRGIRWNTTVPPFNNRTGCNGVSTDP